MRSQGSVTPAAACGHDLVEVLGVALADREDQVVAVGEVQVDRGWRHPDGSGDGPDGERSLIVGLDEDSFGCRQDLIAQLFALSTTGARATSGRGVGIWVAVGSSQRYPNRANRATWADDIYQCIQR